MECEAEQTALAAAGDERDDVEERRGKHAAALEDDDSPALQRQEETRVAGVGDGGRLRESRCEDFERDLGASLGADARSRREYHKSGCEKSCERTISIQDRLP